jgi:hypothetical protein
MDWLAQELDNGSSVHRKYKLECPMCRQLFSMRGTGSGYDFFEVLESNEITSPEAFLSKTARIQCVLFSPALILEYAVAKKPSAPLMMTITDASKLRLLGRQKWVYSMCMGDASAATMLFARPPVSAPVPAAGSATTSDPETIILWVLVPRGANHYYMCPFPADVVSSDFMNSGKMVFVTAEMLENRIVRDGGLLTAINAFEDHNDGGAEVNRGQELGLKWVEQMLAKPDLEGRYTRFYRTIKGAFAAQPTGGVMWAEGTGGNFEYGEDSEGAEE